MNLAPFVLGGSSSRRPQPVQQPALPPWDASDPDGQGDVHTTPPPGWKPGPMNLCGDFTGITLPGRYRFVPGVGTWMLDGPYQGLFIPWLIGANSTPPTMLMSGMLIMYPKDVQDAFFMESAYRGYRDVMLAPDGWNLDFNGFQMTIDKLLRFADYSVTTWGNRTVGWRGQPQLNGDPYLVALWQAGLVHHWGVGEEIDTKIVAEQLPGIIDRQLSDTHGEVQLGIHFTCNPLQIDPSTGQPDPLSKGGGYPIASERDTFLAGGATGGWADWNGLIHLWHQANQGNSAGRQGALILYSRMRVQLGGVGGDGRAAPLCRIVTYEEQATDELYGIDTELYGKLRTLETLYCPADMDGLSMLLDFMNGGSDHDGNALNPPIAA